MPLHTTILRDGKPLKLKWGGFHVAAMVIAASADSGRGPYQDMEAFVAEANILMAKNGQIGISPKDVFALADYAVLGQTPMNDGDYVLKQRWAFHDNADGGSLELLPGDTLRAGRH